MGRWVEESIGTLKDLIQGPDVSSWCALSALTSSQTSSLHGYTTDIPSYRQNDLQLHDFLVLTDTCLPFRETWIFGTLGVDFIKETTMDKTNKVLLVLQDVI
jgi:hypothetical protein